MNLNLKLPQFKGKITKGKMPTKDFINVQTRTKQAFSVKKNLPLLIVIAVAVIVLGKFFVVDKIVDLATEANRISTIQQELQTTKAQISSKGDIEEEYAHYTTSGMTDEELSRVDRVEAMRLVDSAFRGGNVSRSWNLTGNIMTLQVTGSSLSELNQLAADLETDPIVERCVISSANKRTDQNGNVVVTFIIYLQQEGSNEE